MRTDLVLDYARPFSGAPVDRATTADLFGESCKDGDKHACIVEAELRPLDDSAASYKLVAAHCEAGDLWSCRALPADEHTIRFASVPGALGRSVQCQPRPTSGCDIDALRRECTTGFPAACRAIAVAHADEEESEQADERWSQLSIDGCLHGIASECEDVAQYGPQNEDRLLRAQRLCDLKPGSCGALAQAYEQRGDLHKVRDALERDCEYGREAWGSCIDVGERYVTGKLEEPVPGRGQALLDWACPKLAAARGSAALDVFPVCKKSAKRP